MAESTTQQQVSGTSSDWDRLYTAVEIQWPEVDQEELRQLSQHSKDIVRYLSEQVSDDESRIRSILDEYLPIEHSRFQEVMGPIMDRTRYEIDESPVASTVLAMLIGFGVGVLTTTLIYGSRPEPSAWQQIKSRRFFD